MTTRERVDLLARAYPRKFPRADSLRLLRAQLGHADVLDRWVGREGVRLRAIAPRVIYHICAGNLAVSACTSIALGLLLGSRNAVKLPSDREDAATRREILAFARGLPAPLRAMVETHSVIDPQLLREADADADAVIAFGSDAAMDSIRKQLRWNQKFIAHGHAVSLLWIAAPDRLTLREARACAIDILTYDQLGCLSPQAIYVPPRTDREALGNKLSRALETHWQKSGKPARPLATAARIAEARDVAYALGHRVWLPPGGHLGWTLIHDPDPAFTPSPLHGVIYFRQAGAAQLPRALASVAGSISTVGFAGVLSPRLESAFLRLGVTRFCPAGRMQFPPLAWHHDGRAPLAELVTWVDAETP